MTKLSKNPRQSSSTRVLVPLLLFATLAALALGSEPALGASTAPVPKLVAMPAKITTARSGTQDFTITGSAAGLLYPGGPARPIALTLHNPNDVAVYVTAVTVAATTDTPKGCRHSDLVLRQADLSPATTAQNAIVVPPHGHVRLPAQGVAAPTIRLVDDGTDQTTACAGQTFSLTYSGSAHS